MLERTFLFYFQQNKKRRESRETMSRYNYDVQLRQIVKEKVRGKGLEEEQSDENGKIEVVV
jgi:hypothetical protein